MSDYIKREDVVNLGVMMQTYLWTRDRAKNKDDNQRNRLMNRTERMVKNEKML